MRTSITIQDQTGEWLRGLGELALTGRGGPAGTAGAILDNLPALLRMELARIPLALGEASLLADVHNGAILDLAIVGAGNGSIVAWGLADATEGTHPVTGELLARSFEAHHGLPAGQADDLLERLSRIGPAADLAMRIALAAWWADGAHEATVDGFRAVGLRAV